MIRNNRLSAFAISSNRDRAGHIDGIILALILAKEFILDFFGFGLFLNLFICCLIFIRVFTVQWRIPLFAYIAIAAFPFLMLQAISMGGDFDVALKNIARLYQVGLYALFLLYLIIARPVYLRALYEKGFFLLNAILVLNIMAMVFQYLAPGVLVGASDGPQLMSEDVMSGLFGYASTHSVALYTTFVIVYDVDTACRGVLNNRVLIPYVVVISLLSIYVATLNDNKALFFFLPLGVFLCWVIYLAFNYKASGVKTAIFIPLILCFLVLLVFSVPVLRSFVEDYITRSISMIVKAWDINAYVNGSDERFKIIPYSLSLATTWRFGDGFGLADIYQMGYREFNHFGQSDFGSLVIMGGAWFYLLVICFYTKLFTKYCSVASGKRRMLIIAIISLLVLSSAFTQVFTQVRIAIPLLMLCYAFRVYWLSASERQEALEHLHQQSDNCNL